MNKNIRESWGFDDLPAYPGENVILSTDVYRSGQYLTEYGKKDTANNRMQGIWDTTEEEAAAYAKLLREHGYREESMHSIENNRFYRLVKDNQRVYLNYYGNAKRATIEVDESGRPSLKELSYIYEPSAGEEAEYYMFGLKMDPYGYATKWEENTSGYPDYGACLIVKCADNSIIFIDGGGKIQMDEEEDRDRLWKFLLEITGKSQEEVITISAWYVTHFDYDHCAGFPLVLAENPERYKVERVICNLPDLDLTHKGDEWIVKAGNVITNLYPECQDIKLRTGDVLWLADVKITTVYTHTDFADETGIFPSRNFNNTSTVTMMESSHGMKMLVTGDIMRKGESVLCQNFSKETLKCDIFQQPHHNRIDITTLYEYTDSQVMFFTQTVGTLTRDEIEMQRFELAKKWCSEWYCGGTETVGFQWSNGKAELIYQKQNIYSK